MRRGWEKRRRATSLALVALLALAERVSADPFSELVAAARKEGQLNVIALPRDWCGYGRIIDRFASKYGLEVKELDPEAGSAQQIEAIRANRLNPGPQTPDVIDVGLSFGASAKRQGLLQPYRVSTWSTIPDAAKDPEGYWYGDYYGVLGFEINADIVKKAPEDWPDLLAPEYRSMVAVAGYPKTSNQAILAVLAAGLSSAGGDMAEPAEAGLKFFAELSERGNFVPVVGDADHLIEGVAPILIRWDYLALGDRDRLKGKAEIRLVVPKTGVVAGVYVQAISAFAPHPNAAKLWMEHLYSDETQLAWLEGYCRPIRFESLMRDNKVPIRLLEELPPTDDGAGAEPPLFPSIEQQERAREIIRKGWNEIIGVPVECELSDPASIPMSYNQTGSPICSPL